MNISLLNRTETHQNLRIYNYHTFNYNPNYFIWKASLGMCLWKVYIILSPLKFAFSCLHAFYTPGKFSLHKTKFFNTRSLTALLLTLWVCWGPSFRFYIQFGYKPHLKDEFFFLDRFDSSGWSISEQSVRVVFLSFCGIFCFVFKNFKASPLQSCIISLSYFFLWFYFIFYFLLQNRLPLQF